MGAGHMSKRINKEDIELVQSNIAKYSLGDIFEKKWLEENIFLEIERKKVHPLFIQLFYDYRCKILGENLQIIKAKANFKKKIIGKLKREKNRDTFLSLLSEIEFASWCFQNITMEFKIEYEPKSIGDRKTDFKISIKENIFYIEVLTILDDIQDRAMDKIQNDIYSQINEWSGIKNKPIRIDYKLEPSFNEKYVNEFAQCIKDAVSNIKEKIEYSEIKICFKKEGKELGSFSLFSTNKSQDGYIGVISSEARWYNDAGRIKNKILDKVDQFPFGEVNIIVCDLSYILSSDFIDFKDAVLGQWGLQLDPRTSKTREIRHPNGVFAKEEARKRISMVSGFIDFDYSKRFKIANPFSDKKIERKFVEEVF